VNSTMTNGVEQGALPLARVPAQADVPLDVVVRRRDLLSAINLMFDVSGLEDKEIYLALEIDPGHFSNIRKGKPSCHFPTNKIGAAMDLCRSEIPLVWFAYSRGKGLHLLQTEAERLLEQQRIANEKLEAENKLLRDLFQGKR
jgi:hypothetical protein